MQTKMNWFDADEAMRTGTFTSGSSGSGIQVIYDLAEDRLRNWKGEAILKVDYLEYAKDKNLIMIETTRNEYWLVIPDLFYPSSLNIIEPEKPS